MADQRDWDKELAEIDRLMAKDKGTAKPAPAAKGGTAGPPATRAEARPEAQPSRPVAAAPRAGRRGMAVWLITLLGPIGAAALTVWPYSRACGMLLGVYLVGVLGVIAAAIWGMHTAWVSRRGIAMIVAVATLIAGLILAAAEVLPRTGYAAHALTWTCST